METWESTYNLSGWGPPANFVCKEFEGLPFTEATKPEKLGKFFDIFAAPTSVPGTGKRYSKEPVNAPKEDDMGFTIMESKATIKAKKKSNAVHVRKSQATQQA